METLGEFVVEKQRELSHATSKLATLLSAIKLGARIAHRDINKTGLADILSASGAESVWSEVQRKLDLFANEKLKVALKARNIVTDITSREEDKIIAFKGYEHTEYVVLMDPLDSSFNTDVNVSVGTIFSIYRRVTPVDTPVMEEDFLQPDNKRATTGYVIYGSSTVLVYTTEYDVCTFTYDPSLGAFYPYQEWMRFPEKDKTYFINEGSYIKFPNGVKRYIKFCQEKGKSTNCPYTSHYIDSLVTDFHRDLLRDGIYPYPNAANRPDGELRLLYEHNPMAFLAERAGGKANSGKKRTLDITPGTLCQRRSLFVGNSRMIEDVECLIRGFPDA